MSRLLDKMLTLANEKHEVQESLRNAHLKNVDLVQEAQEFDDRAKRVSAELDIESKRARYLESRCHELEFQVTDLAERLRTAELRQIDAANEGVSHKSFLWPAVLFFPHPVDIRQWNECGICCEMPPATHRNCCMRTKPSTD